VIVTVRAGGKERDPIRDAISGTEALVRHKPLERL
jgi:hypothetical protein